MAYKIVFTDYYYPNNSQELEILNRLDDVEIIDLTKVKAGGIIDADELIPYVKDADAVIIQFGKITAKVIAAMEKCRIIARYAIGVDVVDLNAAAAKGIAVANVPDYCIEEVSDTAVAHILNSLRALTHANHLIHEDAWEYDKIKPLKRISESTIGLLAFGNIGRRTAEKLRAFNCSILAFDPAFTDRESWPWVEFVSAEDLFARSDVISVHAPLNDKTRHMLNAEAFMQMKDGVSIVNTSRGGLIDEKALIDALNSGRVRYASLDVLDMQDAEYNSSELLKFPDQVTVTPHLGWYSETSIAELQRKVGENVYEMLKNGEPLYRVV